MIVNLFVDFNQHDMPEGPSIVIVKEHIQRLKLEGKKVIAVDGNAKIDIQRMIGQKVVAIKSWGKHFLICFEGFALRIHFLMFGTYRINERKESSVKLRLGFEGAELNFYTCSIIYVEGDINATYDWSSDIMSEQWDGKKALKKISNLPNEMICDVLLDQQIFAGVGNIIKNEVLYRSSLHPANRIIEIPLTKLRLVIANAREYSFDFLKWKKAFVLKKHWLIYSKKFCPLKHPVEKTYLGKAKRPTFFCTTCQRLYTAK